MRVALAELVERFRRDDSARVADHIPALACADPGWFGLAFADVDGTVHEAGDSRVAFTIQSVSKPFVYALALAELGMDEVHRHVGAEPTGEAFSAISLEPGTGRPANPMINAGAIVTAALAPGASAAERIGRILATLSAFAGPDLEVDEQTLRSERSTGDRNRVWATAGAARSPVPGWWTSRSRRRCSR
ncbi:MAG TPA: glutaminase [Mycobacteriales bacterium]|nr:glutaminase [Mycobacteriales bacterium]